MRDRIVLRRVLCDAGEDRRLGQRQVLDVLVEVLFRCGLHAVGSGAEIDRVQVVFQNQVLIFKLLLELHREILLLELALDPVDQRLLLGPCREYVVLEELLRNRRSALREPASVLDAGDDRAENALRVDAAVLVEALILDCDDCMLQGHRDIVERYGGPVRVRGRELLELVAFRVINERRVSAWRDVDAVDIGRVGDDSADHSDRSAYENDDQADQSGEQHAEGDGPHAPLNRRLGR